MVVPQDEQTLQRLLGVETLPDKVVSEYEIRASLFHRSGSTGPLGPLALVDLVRFLGLRSPKVEAPPVKVDWRALPQNGTVRVEGKFFGDWRPGVFVGLVEHGTLGVRFDDDPVIRECRADMLRLSDAPLPKEGLNIEPVSDTVSQEQPDARAGLLDGPEIVEADEEPWKSKTPNIDWSAITPGVNVWAWVDGDLADGVYVRPSDEGRIVVRVGEKDLSVLSDSVELVDSLMQV